MARSSLLARLSYKRWTKKLVEELQASEAPVLKKLQLSLDPERASEPLARSARPNTLKRYVASYRLWRIYLQETKVRLPPGKPADLVDYLLARKDVEIVAEFVEEDCASYGRLAWAAKDKIVEALSEGAPLTKRAPCYPTMLLVKIERYMLDDSEPPALRVWSDLQAIKPAALRLTDGRLATALRKTKTSGPTKRVKERAVCVSEQAFFEDPRWLETGFELLKGLANFKRDYLLPRLRDDMAGLDKKMAGYGDAMVATAALLTRLQLPGVVQGFWTEHSKSAIDHRGPGLRESLLGPLGCWKPEGLRCLRPVLWSGWLSYTSATPKRPGRMTATWS